MRLLIMHRYARKAFGVVRTLANLVLTVGWAFLAFIVVSALFFAWTKSRRVAIVCALGIAGAFVLGSTSPYVLRREAENPPLAGTPVAAPAAAVPSETVRCARGARSTIRSSRGSIDQITGSDGAKVPVTANLLLAFGDTIHFTGWIANGNAVATSACVVIDGRVAATSGVYGLDRPDVATAYNVPAMERTGYSIETTLPRGKHRVSVAAVEGDGSIDPMPPELTVSAP